MYTIYQDILGYVSVEYITEILKILKMFLKCLKLFSMRS
jgi:hypothetical protein